LFKQPDMQEDKQFNKSKMENINFSRAVQQAPET